MIQIACVLKQLFCQLLDLKRRGTKQNASYNAQSKQITARNPSVMRHLIMSRDPRLSKPPIMLNEIAGTDRGKVFNSKLDQNYSVQLKQNFNGLSKYSFEIMRGICHVLDYSQPLLQCHLGYIICPVQDDMGPPILMRILVKFFDSCCERVLVKSDFNKIKTILKLLLEI